MTRRSASLLVAAVALVLGGCSVAGRDVGAEVDVALRANAPFEARIDELDDETIRRMLLDQQGPPNVFPAQPAPVPRVIDRTMRLSVHGSFRLDDPEASDVTYVLEADGDVLQIREGNIYAGADSYQTWNVGPDGFEQLAERIVGFVDVAARLDVPGTGSGRHLGLWIDGTFFTELRDLDPPSAELDPDRAHVRALFRQLLVDLDDQDWLVGTEPQRQGKWIPDHLGVEVRNSYDTRYYTTPDIPWPFEESLPTIADLADGDETTICLSGSQVAEAWRLFMVAEVNNARLPIVIGEDAAGNPIRREAGVTVSYPTYNISSCPDNAVID